MWIFFVLCCLSGMNAAAIQLDTSTLPKAGSNVFDGSFQGYSIEMASFVDYAGNVTTPNALSINLLRNLQQIAGSPPEIRVGGTTANHASFVPGQSSAIIQNYAVPGADQPANITLGLTFLESFKTFDQATKYTVGVTFDEDFTGEEKSVEEVQFFYNGLGQSLDAIEVGNEFDTFPVGRNTSTWNIGQYVSEWLQRTSAISSRIPSLPRPIYQAGVFLVPGSITPDVSWTTTAALNLGVASTRLAKTFSIHQYFGAACSPVKPTIQTSIFNRTLLQTAMKYHKVSAAAAAANGVSHVIGETNSIACQGLTGISDVFASALWSIDYALYAASVGVTKIFWHTGTGYRYSAWQAIKNGTTTPGPRPLYYGDWFLALALAGPNKQVVPIVNTTNLAGYAIYDASMSKQRPKLASIVLVNLDVYNATATPASSRASVELKLPIGCNWQKAVVRRLTAPSVDARDSITVAGQSVGLTGSIVGIEKAEAVLEGIIGVKASEAVLIAF